MTADDPQAFIRDYYAAWGTGDPNQVLRFFSENASFEDLAFEARFEGLDQIRSFAELTYSGAPDFQVIPTNVFTSPDGSAGAEWAMTGTHKGDFPGLPATGRKFEVRASSMIQIEGGKIKTIRDYWSVDTFRRSVGLL
ncbi:MAG: ester cyclase [Myxococcota bacterium]